MPPTPRIASRFLAALAVTLVVGAAPAAADPAEPTNFRSTITSVEPQPEGLTLSIVGGDSFLRVEVAEGHTLVVEDYDGNPYLQVLEDGTVQENRQSEATYLNEDRYQRIDQAVLEGLDPEGEPDWQTIDDDGEHAWHDHRIHWMSPDSPPDAEAGDVVLSQEIPMRFDGEPVAATVEVTLLAGENVLPWIAVGLLAVGGLLGAGWRRRSLVFAAGGAVAASTLAVVAGNGQLAAAPAGTGTSSLVLIVPAIGLVASFVGAVLVWRKAVAGAGIALLASAASLAGWAILRLSVLWKAVLPTELPENLDRAATAGAVGAAVAVAVLTVRSGAVSPAPLTDDD